MSEARSSRSRHSEIAKIGTLDNEPVFVDANGDVPKPDRVSKRFKFYVRKAGLSDRENCLSTRVDTRPARGSPCRACHSV